MKILTNNMPSIHKIYEYGNIAIEELFDIDISEKVHNSTEEMINEKLASLFPYATRRNGSCTQNA